MGHDRTNPHRPPDSPARYLALWMVVCVISLLAVAAFNYAEDPAQLFGNGGFEQRIADILLSRQNAAGITNCDERLVQMLYISKMEAAPDVAVFGSSRGMQVRQQHFPGRSLFNHSVSGASVEDYLALYELYGRRGIRPSLIVMEVDLWFFTRHTGLRRWRALGAPLPEAIGAAPYLQSIAVGPSWTISRWLSLISYSYLEASLKRFTRSRRSGAAAEELAPALDDDVDAEVMRSDGSRSHKRDYRYRKQSEVNSEALAYAAEHPVRSLEQLFQPDMPEVHAFEALLERARNEGVRVMILLAPYHPETYRLLAGTSNENIGRKYRALVADLARGKGAEVIGYYDPNQCGLTEVDFFDGIHPKESAMNRIFDRGRITVPDSARR